ncbi:MAG: hypothetical protein WC829_05910 [Hyphomicrobium sp.]|jgi:hypothetical protein
MGGRKSNLTDTVMLAGWPTPMAASPGTETYNPAGNTDSSRKTVELVGWATPAAKEAGGTPEQFLARKEKAIENGSSLGVSLTSLSMQAQLVGWATPTTRDHKDGSTDLEKAGVPINGLLRRQVSLASGLDTMSSIAPTGKRAALNPRFSGWLLGFPREWCEAALSATTATRSRKVQKSALDACAGTATPSTRNSRRSSSKRLQINSEAAKIAPLQSELFPEGNMARRPTTSLTADHAFAGEMSDSFAHIVQASIAPLNTDSALEQIARKAFNNGMKRPGVTFEGVLAEVLKEGIRLERVASASAVPAARGRGRPAGSTNANKASEGAAKAADAFAPSKGTGNIGRGDGERETDEEVAARVAERGRLGG